MAPACQYLLLSLATSELLLRMVVFPMPPDGPHSAHEGVMKVLFGVVTQQLSRHPCRRPGRPGSRDSFLRARVSSRSIDLLR